MYNKTETTKPLPARLIKVLQKVEKELGSRKEGNWPLYCAVRKILDEVEMRNPESRNAPKRFKNHTAHRGRWSEWVNPNHNGYFMKCCDCGLVHEMQFAVATFVRNKITKMDKSNRETGIGVVFRARRAK